MTDQRLIREGTAVQPKRPFLHPTPADIQGAIIDVLLADMDRKDEGSPLPARTLRLVREGVRNACAEWGYEA